jgi:hypothetical protein
MPTLTTTMVRTTTLETYPTDPGGSSGHASSNAPNNAAYDGHYATEPTGTATVIERQAGRFSEDQSVVLLTLCGTHGR